MTSSAPQTDPTASSAGVKVSLRLRQRSERLSNRPPLTLVTEMYKMKSDLVSKNVRGLLSTLFYHKLGEMQLHGVCLKLN